MASTFSSSLKLTLIGDGDQSGIWGQTTNTNLGTLVEQAITGVTSIVMSDANYTLSNFNGVTNEARNAVLVVTGANNAVRDVIPPVVKKLYTVVNNTSGGFAIRVIGATGTGVNIPPGFTTLVFCDGINFFEAVSSGTTSVNTSNYTIEQQGNTLVTQYDGANIATLSSTGIFTATTANVTTVNATTANVTTVNSSNVTSTNFNTTNFTITESGGVLQFKYGGSVVMSMDSTGNLISATNITAFGTP
jgi:hypothetical protein